MSRKSRVVLAVWSTVGALILAACSGSPQPELTTTESVPPAVEIDDAEVEEKAPTEVTPLPPSANPALAVVGVETLPAGEPGQLSVVAQGSMLDRSGSLPVVVRNLTDKPMARLEVTGTVRDASGALVGSGSDQLGFTPYVVGPGEIAIGYVYFGMDELPTGATVELAVIGTELGDIRRGQIDLIVAEHNRTADSIVVLLHNDTDEEVSGPIGLILMCFDEAGVPIETHGTYTDQAAAAPGATVSATFDFYFDPPCERYILGGSGYNF